MNQNTIQKYKINLWVMCLIAFFAFVPLAIHASHETDAIQKAEQELDQIYADIDNNDEAQIDKQLEIEGYDDDIQATRQLLQDEVTEEKEQSLDNQLSLQEGNKRRAEQEFAQLETEAVTLETERQLIELKLAELQVNHNTNPESDNSGGGGGGGNQNVGGAAAGSLSSLLASIQSVINLLIPIVFALALLYFFWGIAQYILVAGDEGKKEEGKKKMFWGIIALFVMSSIWGIVFFIADAFGIDVKTIPNSNNTVNNENEDSGGGIFTEDEKTFEDFE